MGNSCRLILGTPPGAKAQQGDLKETLRLTFASPNNVGLSLLGSHPQPHPQSITHQKWISSVRGADTKGWSIVLHGGDPGSVPSTIGLGPQTNTNPKLDSEVPGTSCETDGPERPEIPPFHFLKLCTVDGAENSRFSAPRWRGCFWPENAEVSVALTPTSLLGRGRPREARQPTQGHTASLTTRQHCPAYGNARDTYRNFEASL